MNIDDSPERVLKLKKGSGFYVTADNIAYATAARQARQRILRHEGTPADHELVNGREELLQKAASEKGSLTDDD